MKRIVEMGHPAHMHHFQNIILNWGKKRYEISMSEEDASIEPLNNYSFDYVNLGRYRSSIIRKGDISYLIKDESSITKDIGGPNENRC